MKLIKKIKLHNFKRFQEFSVKLEESPILLIGDNEAGKSTILLAIEIVLSGSRSKVEAIGLDNLFNLTTIQEFLNSDKAMDNLPQLFVELYFNEQNNPDLNGRYNSDNIPCDGLLLSCEPRDDLSREIKDILEQDETNFPFEYYTINFKTFSGVSYTGYRRFFKHIFIDTSKINSEYATKEYVKVIYFTNISEAEKSKHQNEYRKHKEIFKNNVLSEVNSRITDYDFAIRTGSKANLETDLTIEEDGIGIENKGKGKQCFIKAEFALRKKDLEKGLDFILLEEPENHLSHLNMNKLIRRIQESDDKQIFITTHNNMICTRLDLRKSILLSSNSTQPALLKNLPESTAKYFMKASNNNILQYVLSKKAILVEGDAEFILMESFYKTITGEHLENSDVHVISIGGTSFKRYLDIGRLLNIRTAVIRDNDGNFQQNCVDNFSDYTEPFINIFYDADNSRYTFEVAFYADNTRICDELFATARRTLTVQEFMLKNKTDAAYELLDKKADELNPPQYIREAIEWIRE